MVIIYGMLVSFLLTQMLFPDYIEGAKARKDQEACKTRFSSVAMAVRVGYARGNIPNDTHVRQKNWKKRPKHSDQFRLRYHEMSLWKVVFGQGCLDACL